MSPERLLDAILEIENDLLEHEKAKDKRPWYRKIFKRKNKKKQD